MFLSGRPQQWQPVRKLGLALVFASAAFVSGVAHAKEQVPATATISLQQLPVEAQETRRLVESGGPFPYAKDGVTFGNRERMLPSRQRGYYREYTVITPGARDRGARRIVCGGRQVTVPDACFYSDDHYTSFRRIVQ